MCQHNCYNQCRLAILSGNTEVRAVGAMRVIVDIQSELLLKLHQLVRLTDLRAFWDFAVRLNDATIFLPRVILCVNLPSQTERKNND